MNKLAKLARKPALKKVYGLFFAALMIVSMALPSFATEVTSDFSDEFGGTAVEFTAEAENAMTEILETIIQSLNIGTILKFVGAAVAVAVGFFIFWWGTRKVIKVVRKAFASGKVSV